MFYPVYDENPLKSISFQYVTIGLIVLNIVLYFAYAPFGQQAVISFGLVPAELFKIGVGPAPALQDTGAVPKAVTLISYMFFHGNIWHLAGNMLFLWVFGDNVEDALGHVKFLLFYLACGVAGGLMHTLVWPNSPVPLIGASGAVAGIIAAYLMLHPRVRVWVMFLRFIPLRISAAFMLGAWVLHQVVMVLLPSVDNIAWWAHIGGLVAGAVLVLILRRPGVMLFDRGLEAAPAKATS